MTIVPERLSPLPGASWDFARRGGQLRVSFTPRCQLGCWFCHNEGEVPSRLTRGVGALKPRPQRLSSGDFLRAIEAMTGAGIRRVFFTGGEPLLSPLARPVLQGLPEHSSGQYTTTLITNGLTLTRDLPWLAECALDRLKVSLHYFSDATIKEIAGGRPGDVAKIKAGIEASVAVFDQVELNLLLQRANQHEVLDIIAYAQDLGVNLQIIELVDTDHNQGSGGARITSHGIAGYLRSIATGEDVITTGTGQGRRVFTVGSTTIEVIDAGLGRHHVGQCTTCPVKDRCVEGYWALRLDSAGALLPCLLRPDLRLDITAHLGDQDTLGAAIGEHLDAFTTGAL